jgi:hypothetical protein
MYDMRTCTIRSLILAILLSCFGLPITLAGPEAPPPIITLTTINALHPRYTLNFSPEQIAWVEGELPANVTPTPTPHYNEPIRPVVHMSADGSRAVIVTPSASALWLVDLVAGTWRPFRFPAGFTGNSRAIQVSLDFSWLALTGESPETDVDVARFWQLDSLFALGGAPIAAGPPAPCVLSVTVGSTTLRAAPDVNAGALGYPLFAETFIAQALTVDGAWVEVLAGEQRGWINTDFVAFDEICNAVPLLLERGTEDSAAPLPSYYGNGVFVASGLYYSGSYHAGLTLTDPARGTSIYHNPDLRHYERHHVAAGARFHVFSNGIFDFQTRSLLTELEGQEEFAYHYAHPVRIVASPDETRLLVIFTTAARLYDIQTGALLKQLALLAAPVEGDVFRWSPDGRYVLLTAHRDVATRDAFLWDTTHPDDEAYLIEGGAVTPLPRVEVNDFPLDFTSDSAHIILDNRPTVWNIANAAPLDSLPLSQEVVYGGVLLPQRDGLLRYNPTREHTEIVALDGEIVGNIDSTLSVNAPYIEFLGGGRWLVMRWDMQITLLSADGGGYVQAYSTPTPTPAGRGNPVVQISRPNATPTLAPMPTLVMEIAAAPSAALVPPPDDGTKITARTLADIRPLHIIQHPLPPDSEARVFLSGLSADGTSIATAAEDTLIVWSVATGEALRQYTFGVEGSFRAVAVSRDLSRAAIITDADELLLAALSQDGAITPLLTASHTGYPRLQFSEDGSRLAVTHDMSPQDTRDVVSLYDTTRGERMGSTQDSVSGFITFTSHNRLATITGEMLRIYSDYGVPAPEVYLGQLTDVRLAERTKVSVQVINRVNLGLIRFGRTTPYQILQGHMCAINAVTLVEDAADEVMLASLDGCGEIRFWNLKRGAQIPASEAAVRLPHGLAIAGRRAFIGQDGEVIWWASPLNVITQSNSLRLQAEQAQLALDATAFVQIHRSYIGVYGLPSEERPAFRSILAEIVPSAVNVRAAPSLNAAIIGTARQGVVVVAGRDASGQFVYLPAYEGWVNMRSAYIDLLGVAISDLPTRPAD